MPSKCEVLGSLLSSVINKQTKSEVNGCVMIQTECWFVWKGFGKQLGATGSKLWSVRHTLRVRLLTGTLPHPHLLLLGTLTLIIAFDVMRKRVARSFTTFSFSPHSDGILRLSSSLRERWRAAPCLARSSLHVLRSFNFSERVLRVWWRSLLSAGAAGSSSSSPESSGETNRIAVTNQARVSAIWATDGRTPYQSEHCPRPSPTMLLARVPCLSLVSTCPAETMGGTRLQLSTCTKGTSFTRSYPEVMVSTLGGTQVTEIADLPG